MPDPMLIGRNAEKIEALAKAHGIARFGTNLDAALDNREDTVFFDAGTTQMRPTLLAQALRAGKHVYCEKPIATNLNEAVEVCRLAQASGLKHGAVQDKLFLPGLRKLDMLRRAGFFGRMLTVRIEFGYWVFEGDLQPIQRPSWNYRTEDGGGMILDMMCHWRYVLDNLFGEVQSISCLGATHIPQRWDEAGQPYAATADDAAYATAQLKGHNGEPVVAQLTMSWATRVRRDDLVTFHVDGTHGSAVAGLQDCRAQSRVTTPRPVWNPDVKQTMNFFDQWQEVPDAQVYDNGFKIQWEAFIRHVAEDAPYRWTLPEGAKGVQLVEAALQSWKERRWVDVPAAARSEEHAHGAATHPARRRRPARSPTPARRGAVRARRAGHALQPHRLLGRARGGRRARRHRPVAAMRDRLGRHHRLPPAAVAHGPGRGRGDGHGAARHGAGLADLAGADPPLASTRRATCPAPSWPAAAAPTTWRSKTPSRSTT